MTRKSLGTYYSAYFKMPDIRRSDLTEIENVILKDIKPERYHLACQGTEYDNVESIPTDLGTVPTLVVYTHAPCLRLKFARSWSELYVEQNNEQIGPAAKKISSIVSNRERRALWRFSKLSIWLAPLIGFGGVTETIELIRQERLPISASYGMYGLLALAALWWAIGHQYTLFRFSRIHLSE